MGSTLRILTWTTAGLTLLNGGVYLAFSTFVLPALQRLPAAEAARAMQQINVLAPRSGFLVPFLGSAAGGAVVCVAALTRLDGPARLWLVGGAALAVAAFALTIGYHVPRNDALGRLDPASAAAAWQEYAAPWLRWNHVRGALCVLSAAALAAGTR